MTLTLTYDQSPASYGHNLPASKSSRLMVSWFQRQSGNKRMDRWTEVTALPPTNEVGNKYNQEDPFVHLLLVSQ